MEFKSSTIYASFLVAIFASFLTALSVLLVKVAAISRFDIALAGNITINIFILLFLSGFIFFKGSVLAAWLVYRHDVPWGFKLGYRKVWPIFITSFVMSAVVFSAIYFYSIGEIEAIAYLQKSIPTIKDSVRF